MKKGIKVLLIVFICAAIVAGGIFAYARVNAAKPVDAVNAANWMLWYMPNQSWLYGIAASDGSQTVTLYEGEKVLELYVAEGDTVRAGDPLLKLDGTKKELELEEKKLKLERTAQQLQKDYKAYKQWAKEPYDVPLLTPTPKPEKAKKTALGGAGGPSALRLSSVRRNSIDPDSGSGTESDPYIFHVTDGTGVSAAFVASLRKEAANRDRNVKAVLQGSEMKLSVTATAAGGVSFTVSVKDGSTKGDLKSPVSGNGTKSDPFAYRYADGADVTADFTAEKTALAVSRGSAVYVTLKNDRYLSAATFGADGAVSFTMNIIDPTPTPSPTPVPTFEPEPTVTPHIHGGMSKEDRLELVREARETILKDELAYRQLLLDIESLERTIGSSIVHSTVTGTVTLANASPKNGEPAVEVSGGSGIYVACVIGEAERDKYPAGTEMTGFSYENGENIVCRVTGVDDTPLTESYSNGGNPNSSAYVLRMEIVEGTVPYVGAYIEFTADNSLVASGKTYLFEAFVSEEADGKYVYVVRDGTVRREPVTTGAIVQKYVELQGLTLTESDYIVFPGEPRCRDGAQAKLVTDSYYYGY